MKGFLPYFTGIFSPFFELIIYLFFVSDFKECCRSKQASQQAVFNRRYVIYHGKNAFRKKIVCSDLKKKLN